MACDGADPRTFAVKLDDNVSREGLASGTVMEYEYGT